MKIKRILAAVLVAVITLSGISTTDILRAENRVTGSAPYGDGKNSEWAEYSSYYIYNQLNDEERKFYDALMEECLLYLTEGDIKEDEYFHWPVLPGVDFGNMTEDRAFDIYTLFCFENPEFYYIYHDIRIENQGKLYPVVYDAFCTQSDRRTGLQQMKSKLNEYEGQINSADSEYDKIKAIHDLICDKVSVNEEASGNLDHEQEFFSQSAYSSIVLGSTVCVGYTDAFNMLCNKLGINCFTVVTEGHVCNYVAIDDVWYVVDCTEDDNRGPKTTYHFFLRNLSGAQSVEKEHHVPRKYIVPYLPATTEDCPPSNNGYTAGKPKEVTETAKAPKLTYENGKFSLTAEGADKIFYTIDGKTPEMNKDRCFVYTAPVKAKEGTVVKAIATESAKRNSRVITWTLGEADPTYIDVGPSEVELKEGEAVELTVDVYPEDAQITWTSSDESIATVEDAIVTGVSAGTATITATCGDASAAVKVTVIEKKNSTITASPMTLNARKLKKKAQTVDIMVEGSDGAVTIENTTENAKLAKKVKIVDKKIMFKKKAKKGTYTFKVTVAGNASYKETTETIAITVQ